MHVLLLQYMYAQLYPCRESTVDVDAVDNSRMRRGLIIVMKSP